MDSRVTVGVREERGSCSLSSTRCQTQRGVPGSLGYRAWARYGGTAVALGTATCLPLPLPKCQQCAWQAGSVHSPSGRAGAGAPRGGTAPEVRAPVRLWLCMPTLPTCSHSPCFAQAGVNALALGSGSLALGANTGSRAHSQDRQAPSSVPGSRGGIGWHPTVPLCLWGPPPPGSSQL